MSAKYDDFITLNSLIIELVKNDGEVALRKLIENFEEVKRIARSGNVGDSKSAKREVIELNRADLKGIVVIDIHSGKIFLKKDSSALTISGKRARLFISLWASFGDIKYFDDLYREVFRQESESIQDYSALDAMVISLRSSLLNYCIVIDSLESNGYKMRGEKFQD